MLRSIDSCKRGVCWPVLPDCIAGWSVQLLEVTCFFNLTAGQLLVLIDHKLLSIISSVRSLQGNLRPRPWSLGQYIRASVWDFRVITSLSVDKEHIEASFAFLRFYSTMPRSINCKIPSLQLHLTHSLNNACIPPQTHKGFWYNSSQCNSHLYSFLGTVHNFWDQRST